MNRILYIAALAIASALGACNNSKQPAQEKAAAVTHNHNSDSGATEATEPVTLAPSFTGVDAKATASIKTLVTDYLLLKDALANGKATDARKAAGNMASAMHAIDKSLFTPEQRKLYDAGEDNLEGYAERIAGTAAIDGQRREFAAMSETLYPLVKAFGGGRILYHDHCPMYGDHGAMWISETKEIRNPYMGEEMPSCGEVKEIISSYDKSK